MRRLLVGIAVLLLTAGAVAFVLLRSPSLAPGVLLAVDVEPFAQRMGLAGLGSTALRVEAFAGGHQSAHAMALQPVSPARFGLLRLPLALPRPAPRWVRLSAWVSAPEGAEVHVELEADGEVVRSPPAPTGAEWAPIGVTVPVPAGAQSLRLGLRVFSEARVLVDDVKVEAVEGPAPRAAAARGVVRGQVVDASGKGTAARVQLVDPSFEPPAAVAATDAAGRFELEAPLGHYGLVAFAPGATVGYVEWVAVATSPTAPVTVSVGGPGDDVRGRLAPAGADAWVGVGAVSDRATDIFVVRPETSGAFALRVPPGRYRTVVAGKGLDHEPREFDSGDAGTLELVVGGVKPSPPDPALVQALRAAAVPIRGTAREGGDDDLASLAAWVGDARVLGVGEATHGTREFAALRLRLLSVLVRERGFSTLAIEGNGPEVAALDAYVQGGPGPVEPLLAGLRYWMWSTEEFRAAIEWLRAWNARQPHRVHLAGVDMQYGGAAAKELAAFLRSAAPAEQAELLKVLATVDDTWIPFAEATGPRAEALAAALATFAKAVETQQRGWESRTSAGAVARMDLARRTLTQYATLIGSRDVTAFNEARDRFLGANLLELVGAGDTRVVFWAHNGHVSREKAGRGLVEAKVPYRALGFLFGSGRFLARRMSQGQPLEAIELGPAPAGTLEATLAHAVEAPIFFVPTVLPEPAGAWLASPQRVRTAGAAYLDDASLVYGLVPDQHFDGFIYVSQMSAMTPLPGR